MQNFEYCTPTRIIFGKGVIEKLPEVLGGIGKKVLLTYGGGSIKKIGLYDKVKELLKDFEITELPGIQPNPKYDPSVLEGVRLCKENGINVFGIDPKLKPETIAEQAIEQTYKFFESIGIPMHLKEVGIGPERIQEMAHHVAVNEGLENAYVPLNEKDIAEILTASL